MQARLNVQKVAPGVYRAMLDVEKYVRTSSRLEPSLLELVTVLHYFSLRHDDIEGKIDGIDEAGELTISV